MMGAVATCLIAKKVEYAILRPTWFMENFSEMQHLPMIRDEDRIVTATGGGEGAVCECGGYCRYCV